MTSVDYFHSHEMIKKVPKSGYFYKKKEYKSQKNNNQSILERCLGITLLKIISMVLKIISMVL